MITTQKIFLTGGTGFIGSAVLDRLASGEPRTVVCLTRRVESLGSRAGRCEFVPVAGDLIEPASFTDHLQGVDAILHLAAATGSARDEELDRVNVRGTEALLSAARQAGVPRVIFASSIAVRYDRLEEYPYGETKARAERLVESSGLDYTVIRPTVVLGRNGNTWAMLRKLASLPVVPLIGGGRARVQPIDVGDVAHAFARILDDRDGRERVVELGGPDIVTFRELLQRMRKASGRRSQLALPTPAAPLRSLLRAARVLSRGRFPVAPGQLTAFLNDSVAAPSQFSAAMAPGMTRLDALLADLYRDAR